MFNINPREFPQIGTRAIPLLLIPLIDRSRGQVSLCVALLTEINRSAVLIVRNNPNSPVYLQFCPRIPTISAAR